MSNEEKIELLSEVLDMDPEDIDADMKLEEMDEWDSLNKLGLMAEVKAKMKQVLSVEQIQGFQTIQDILDYLQ